MRRTPGDGLGIVIEQANELMDCCSAPWPASASRRPSDRVASRIILRRELRLLPGVAGGVSAPRADRTEGMRKQAMAFGVLLGGAMGGGSAASTTGP